MTDFSTARAAYAQQGMMSSSPSGLLVLLYDRLLRDLHTAEASLMRDDQLAAIAELFHAQSIVLELAGSLRPELWEGGERMLALYGYLSRMIAHATTDKDPESTREAIRVAEPLADAWREAALLAGAAEVRGVA